jgi:hypothetical protein
MMARAAGIEAKRRVLPRHERGVGHDPKHPAVEAEHEIEDVRRIPVPEQEQGSRHEDEDADEPRR